MSTIPKPAHDRAKEIRELVKMLADNAEPSLGMVKTNYALHDIFNNLRMLTEFADRWIDYCRVSDQNPFRYFDR